MYYYIKYLGHWYSGFEDKPFMGFQRGEIKGPYSLDDAATITSEGKCTMWSILRPVSTADIRLLDGSMRPEELRQFIQHRFPPHLYSQLYPQRFR